MIILKHIEHGTHFALEEMEAQECERNGWVRVDDLKDNPFVNGSEPQSLTAEIIEPEIRKDPKMGKFNRGEHMRRMWAEGRMKKAKV